MRDIFIPLGTPEKPTKVKDRLTNFEGTVVARAEYLYGCTWIGVVSKALHEGRPIPEVWLDEVRLIVRGRRTPEVACPECREIGFHAISCSRRFAPGKKKRYGPSPASMPPPGPTLIPASD